MNVREARHAFVTGGASGIGLGIADALASSGVAVTIADINEQALASVVAERGTTFGGQVLDVRDREGWERAVRHAEAVFGPIDILVNNAGIATNGKTFIDMSPESFDRIVAINLTGVYNGIWALAGAMAERGRGHIVITSSEVGLVTAYPGIGPYAAAKFGVTALGEVLRTELAERGIGVTLLFPGHIRTNLAANTQRLGGDARQFAEPAANGEVTSADVGAMVIDAITRDAAHLFTHKTVWPMVEARFQAIKSAFQYSQNDQGVSLSKPD